MRKPIAQNPLRSEFMRDILEKDFVGINKKWGPQPSIKLSWQKYIWGNRQKIAFGIQSRSIQRRRIKSND